MTRYIDMNSRWNNMTPNLCVHHTLQVSLDTFTAGIAASTILHINYVARSTDRFFFSSNLSKKTRTNDAIYTSSR